MCMVPLITCPVGNPVTALPGATPRSPDTIVGPVLVTALPANTAKGVAVPNPTGGCAADATPPQTASVMTVPAAINTISQRRTGPPRTQCISDGTKQPLTSNTPADWINPARTW